MGQDGSFWEDAERLFAEAIELDAADRAAFLDRQCDGRPQLRTELDSLIAAHHGAEGFLDGATVDAANPSEASSERFVGRTVGRFRLLEKIGEGGMGVVFRAERADGEFVQQVAVKLIDAPLRTPEAVRRFRAERQILATLNHPHIVTLLDGGVTDEGQAYLVMECIDGVSITRYCAEHQLPLDDRLRLFRDVCGAVQDAHQHAVVHRDLKPANILVTRDGVPKILDFGIAKLLDGSPEAEATATGMLRPLTANYASPEQLRGLPVTIASDIYALGVLLYELLTSVRPYETADKPLDEVLAIVLNEDPRRPSAVTTADTQLPYPGRRLRGDLDAVVLRAMHKDPAQRYASAQALRDDIGRYLEARPVLARLPLWAGFTRVWKRRRKAMLLSAAASIVVIAALMGVFQYRAMRARTAAAVRQLYVKGLFQIRQSDAASVSEGIDFLRQAVTLDRRFAPAYAGIAEGLSNRPLGDRSAALERAERAVALDPQCPECLATRGKVKTSLHRWNEAKADLRQALVLNPNDSTALIWLSRAEGLTGDMASALRHVEAAIRDPQGPNHNTSNAWILYYDRRFADAVDAANHALAIDSRNRVAAWFLGLALLQLGRTEEAVDPILTDYLGGANTPFAEEQRRAFHQTYQSTGIDGVFRRILSGTNGITLRPYDRAVYLLMLRQDDDALPYLETALTQNDRDLLTTGVHPLFDPLRDNPRFLAIVTALDLSDVNAATKRRLLAKGLPK